MVHELHELTRIRLWVILLIAICSLLIVTACAPVGDGIDNPIPAGMGRVTLKLADTVGRTIMPAAPASVNYFNSFEVNFHDTVADEALLGSPFTVGFDTNSALESITVPPGDYIITVDAFTEVNSTSTLAARGVTGTMTSPVTINPNQTNNVPVNLKMLLGENGTSGTFTWDITVPDPSASSLNITKAELTINTLKGDPVGNEEDLLASSTGTRTPLDSGMYNVIVNLVHTENFGTSITDFARSVVIWYETLHIYSTLTSDWTYTFTEDHFRLENYIVTFDHNYTPSKPADLKQSVLHNETIGTMPTPSRDGYSIEGWYTDPDPANGTKWLGTGSGFEIYEDMTLYANWLQDTTVVINVAVDPITDVTITLTDNSSTPNPIPVLITLSRSPNVTGIDEFVVQFTNHTDFTSFEWRIQGVGGAADVVQTSSDTNNPHIFYINANNVSYNSLGRHTLRLTVVKDGITYMRNIEFVIVP